MSIKTLLFKFKVFTENFIYLHSVSRLEGVVGLLRST